MNRTRSLKGVNMKISDTMYINGGRAALHSYAKINLTLDVLSKRPDGYHDISSVMQTVSLADTVVVDRTRHGISVKASSRYVPDDSRNIAWKAADAFFEYTGIRGGCNIAIHKNIPVAAGLAGGSGNGAAVLVALDALYSAALSYEQLCGIAAKLGADVPYCINGGAQLARGIGEELLPLGGSPALNILLVKPLLNISTAAVYREIDSVSPQARPDTDGMISAIKSGSAEQIADRLCNVMETVTEREHPQIAGIKRKMLSEGALGTLMSGSGPTVFGIFPDAQSAKRAADRFFIQFKDTYAVTSV